MAALENPPVADEPKVVSDPPLANPAFDENNIKAMAAKFRQLSKDAPAPAAAPTTAPKPDAAPAAAAPAPDPAAAAAAPEDDIKVDANTPVTRDHFKRLAQSRDAYREKLEKIAKDQEQAAQRARQLEEELTKTKSALPPNLEEVQKALADAKRHAEENKRLTEELETINLERSPRFQNWWKSETGKHLKVAQAHVPADKREEISKLLMEPPSSERDAAIDEILEPLSNTSRRLATGALEAIESLRLQREEALTQGSARYRELVEHEKAEAQKAQEAQQAKLETLTQEAMKRAKNYTAFQPTGDPTVDAEIPQREAFVKAVMQGKVDQDVMLAMPAISIEYLHLTEKVIPGLKSEIAKQTELIKQLQGATPRAASGTAPARGKEEPADGKSFARRVAELYQGKPA